jgi:hypothetical protein
MIQMSIKMSCVFSLTQRLDHVKKEVAHRANDT